MEKFLIVNADDYGFTAGVSEGIRQAHLNGLVTSTTAMMNHPGVLEAVNAARHKCPNLGIGVHLVLTEGKPVLPPEQIPSLVDERGNFFNEAEFIAHLESIHPDEALLEWRAQIEVFKRAGQNPDHLDSHHHSSYFTPALFERMLALAQELKCPIRKAFGESPADFADYLSGESAKEFEQQILNLLNRFQPDTTQVFLGDFYDTGAVMENLKTILKEIADDPSHATFELMCHPAIVDDNLRRITSYNDPRGREHTLLQDTEVKYLIQHYGIRLINFSDLPHEKGK